MRYLFGFLCVCALVALPLSVGAQDAEEGATAEPNLQEPTPSSEPAPEEPALQLNVDDLGVNVVPVGEGGGRSPRHGMHPAGIVCLTMTGVTVVGAVLVGVGMTRPSTGDLNRIFVPVAAGAVLMMVGGVGMIISGVMWGKRTRQERRLQEADYGRPRRVQWDPAQSRVVF
jgi:hypothetical protein